MKNLILSLLLIISLSFSACAETTSNSSPIWTRNVEGTSNTTPIYIQLSGLVSDNGTVYLSAPGVDGIDGIDGQSDGNVTILPWNYSSIIQGTWVYSEATGPYLGYRWYNSTNSINDGISYSIYMGTGNYTARILHATTNSGGKAHVHIDSTEIAIIDFYSAGTTDNVVDNITNIEITSPGLKSIRIISESKNASSSGYHLHIVTIALWRTS